MCIRAVSRSPVLRRVLVQILFWLLTSATFIQVSAEEVHIRAATLACETAQGALQAKDYQAAAEHFRQAIEIEPTYLAARQGLIKTYLASGQESKAASEMTQLLEIEPDASAYRLQLGQILLREKQFDRALAQFSLARKTDRRNAEALLGFATAAEQAGMHDRATAALAEGRTLFPSDERFVTSQKK